MCVLILLYGIATVSWYAELALRRRVSMSAIGSVMVIFVATFLASLETSRRRENRPSWFEGNSWIRLPRALGNAGEFAGVCHLADTDPAQAEHPVDRTRPATARASGVAAHLELRLAAGFGDH